MSVCERVCVCVCASDARVEQDERKHSELRVGVRLQEER